MKKKVLFFHDTLVMTQRCLLLSKRNLDTILTSIILPVLMMTLFVYVFGGAIHVGNDSYVNYIVPGIILQCIGQCASTTAIELNEDLHKGIVDRFCTMPMKSHTVLSGHVLEALIRNMVTALIVVSVAILIGFRPQAVWTSWLMVFLVLGLYVTAISWMSVYFGLIAKSAQGAGALTMLAIILPYVSSGFVPVDTMPSLMKVFAQHQPMTPIMDTLRSLMLGTPLAQGDMIQALAWCIGLTLLFMLLAIRKFHNRVHG